VGCKEATRIVSVCLLEVGEADLDEMRCSLLVRCFEALLPS
jgi:hypothetical protein